MYQEISNPMDYHVALYIRLSKEDESEGPSQSVTNQKSLLEEFTQSTAYRSTIPTLTMAGAAQTLIVLRFSAWWRTSRQKKSTWSSRKTSPV